MAATLLPKQRLKDYCRRKQYSAPVYVLTEEEKIDLHKHYTVQVAIQGLVTAEARGLSRRIAEFKAAMNAMHLIGQSDPSVFDNYGTQSRFARLTIGRSYSVDHISRAQRTDSIPSMMSLAMGTVGQFSSAAPSIDGIDSLTENNDSLYGSEIAGNGKDENPNRVEEEEASSDSTDEGVEMEISDNSATPLASSPTSSAPSRAASVIENNESESKTPTNDMSLSCSSNTTIVAAESSIKAAPQKSKSKKSLSSSFLSSFFMLSSLRRSLRRKAKSSSVTKAEFSLEESPAAVSQPAPSRPTSATSAVSNISSSSAFSSNASITSSHQTSSSSSTSGSFTLPDDGRVETDGPLVNGYTNLITESIIEEEEEEEEEDEAETLTESSIKRKESAESETLCSSHHSHDYSGSKTMPRSASSNYVLSSMCPHNHFSIYGPVLCSNQHAAKNLTIESTPSAALLRYCVRMYLALPYYDIRFFDSKFYVTCRIMLTTSKTETEKLPISLPEEYKNSEFTARGNGETLRNARNMAAQTIIDKLKRAALFFE